MDNLEYVRKYIEVLKGKEEGRVLEALKGLQDIGRDEKNIIYTYLFPKPIRHMELPKLIMENRGELNASGFLSENIVEILILLRAYNTRQYGKYIRHLLHSFIQDTGKLFIEGSNTGELVCGSCGKKLFDYGTWSTLCKENPGCAESQRREYLAYGSTQSSQHLCLDCIIQFQKLNSMLEEIEGKNYLSLWK